MKPGTRLSAVVISGILAFGVAAAGCGSDSDEASDSPGPAATDGAGSTDLPGDVSGEEPSGGPGEVSRQEAGRIAVAYMEDRYGQPGRVTFRGQEDDAGARWQIEVTLDGGREFDVLVSASGDVIRVK